MDTDGDVIHHDNEVFNEVVEYRSARGSHLAGHSSREIVLFAY